MLHSLQSIVSFLEKNTPDLIILHFQEFNQVHFFLDILDKKCITYITMFWYPQKKNVKQAELVSCYTKGIDCILEEAESTFLLQAKINGCLKRITLLEYYINEGLVIRMNTDDHKDKDALFMDKVELYLAKNHLKNSFNISKMGEDLGMSRTNFYSQIKRITKGSPSQMVMEYRLKIAKTLLEENKKTISEIAFDTGFTSTAYFTKSFKKKYLSNPSTYRKINLLPA